MSQFKGYEGQGCVNINECINGDHLCVEHSTCFDNDGSYTCECDYGYEGYGRKKCDNVNECSRRVGECSKFALCIDKKGWIQTLLLKSLDFGISAKSSDSLSKISQKSSVLFLENQPVT